MSNEPTPSKRLGWMRFPAPIAAFIAFSPVSSRAEADGHEPIRIETDGAIACTTAEEFFERVKRRVELARKAGEGEPGRTFTIAVAGSPPALSGRLIIAHPDGRATHRDVTGESCDEVVDALALITAIDIDPRYVMPPPLEKLDLPIPGPPPEPERPLLVAPPPSVSRWQGFAGAAVSATSGIAPGVLLGTPVFVEFARRSESAFSPSFTAGFERTFNRTAIATDGDAVFYLVRASLQACPLAWSSGRLRVAPCVRIDGGVLHGEGKPGKSIETAGADQRAWVAGDLAGRAAVWLGGPMYLDAQLGVGTPFVQPYKFQVNPNIPLGEVQRWNWRAGFGVQVRFL